MGDNEITFLPDKHPNLNTGVGTAWEVKVHLLSSLLVVVVVVVEAAAVLVVVVVRVFSWPPSVHHPSNA